MNGKNVDAFVVYTAVSSLLTYASLILSFARTILHLPGITQQASGLASGRFQMNYDVTLPGVSQYDPQIRIYMYICGEELRDGAARMPAYTSIVAAASAVHHDTRSRDKYSIVWRPIDSNSHVHMPKSTMWWIRSE
ncbi:hypothetical protein OSTOST_04525 [Ostertagia ostertagi]